MLAIDGGGSRGVIPAKILERIEAAIKRPIWQVFDFGAGVSTGGLVIMSALLRRTPPNELVKIYRTLASKIFENRVIPIKEHSARRLESELKEHYGSLQMNRPDDRSPYVFVTAIRDHEPDPFLLRNYDVVDQKMGFAGESDWPCSDAARATTAAPTYFTPFVSGEHHYSDGALGFDNPVVILFMEALNVLSKMNERNNDDDDDMPTIDYIVSIGTGKMEGLKPPSRKPKKGLRRAFQAVELALEFLTDFENHHSYMKILAKSYGNIPYFRFSPPLPGRPALDIRSSAKLDELINITEAYLNDQNNGIPEQIQQLAELINQW